MATTKSASKKAKSEVTTNVTSEESKKSSAMNFDFLNSFSLEKFKKSDAIKQGAREIYKLSAELSEEERKTARRKLKKQRNNVVKNLLASANDLKLKNNAENQKSFLSAAKLFNEFYLKNYVLNDYSIDSLSSSNAKDRATLQIALDIAKNVK